MACMVHDKYLWIFTFCHPKSEKRLPPVHFFLLSNLSPLIPFFKLLFMSLEDPDQHWTISGGDLTGEDPLSLNHNSRVLAIY
jgi:hypothetical protein